MRQAFPIVLIVLAGCSQAVMVANETDRGGIVSYIYKEGRGPMLSPHRSEALTVIRQKCPNGYSIVREGEARADQAIGGNQEGNEDAVRHRWALQFTCKG